MTLNFTSSGSAHTESVFTIIIYYGHIKQGTLFYVIIDLLSLYI